MNATSIAILSVVGFIAVDAMIVLVVGRLLVSTLWKPLAHGHEHVEPLPDAVRKNFQSFRIATANFGFCVHVAVDENRLHLLPARFLRWFGARPMSIPWDQVNLKKRGGHWSSVKIGKRSVHGPAWCLNLAEPEPGAD